MIKLNRNQIIAAAIMVIIALVVYRMAMPRQRDGFLGGLLKGIVGGVGKMVGIGGKEAAGQAAQAQAPAKTNPQPKGGCQYKTRIWINNGWGCEPGWYDTGAMWDYGANGDKQCENCSAPTAAPAAAGRTNPPGRSGCQYKTRSWINNGWNCEAGWKDTGAMWDYGPNGEKQCEKC